MKILDISPNKEKKEEREIKYTLKKINCLLPYIVIYYFSIVTDHR